MTDGSTELKVASRVELVDQALSVDLNLQPRCILCVCILAPAL